MRLAAEDGGTLIEFGVVIILLLTVMFGVMDCSRALYFQHFVRYSAEEASRYARTRGSTWNGASCATVQTVSCTATAANIAAMVKSLMTIGNSSSITVTSTWSGKKPSGAACMTTYGTNSPGCVVQVQVQYSFVFIVPFLPKNTINLSSASAVAIAQ